MQAVFSQGGISGNVLFVQDAPGAPVKIHLNLMGLDQNTNPYRWSIRQFPVRTSLLRDFPCSEDNIGGVFNPTNANSMTCNNTAANMCPAGDLTTVLGPVFFDMPWQIFEDTTGTLSLSGPNSIIGRPLVLDRPDGPEEAFICSNIEQLGVRRETLRAAFDNGVLHGDVVLRFAIGRDDALIEADLHRVDDGGNTINSVGNMWYLYSGVPGPNNSCNGLDIVSSACEPNKGS